MPSHSQVLYYSKQSLVLRLQCLHGSSESLWCNEKCKKKTTKCRVCGKTMETVPLTLQREIYSPY